MEEMQANASHDHGNQFLYALGVGIERFSVARDVWIQIHNENEANQATSIISKKHTHRTWHSVRAACGIHDKTLKY